MISDRLSGGLLLLLGMAAIVVAWGFYVPYQYEPLGPQAMPYLVGGMLILCGVRLIVTPSVKHLQPMQAQQQPGASRWRPVLLCILLLGYAFCYESLGFLISSLFVCSALAFLCGARLSWSLMVAAGLAVVGHLMLVQVLELQLPLGLLEGLL